MNKVIIFLFAIIFFGSCKSMVLQNHYQYRYGPDSISFNQIDSTFTLIFWHLGNDTISGRFTMQKNRILIKPFFAKVIEQDGSMLGDSVKAHFQCCGQQPISNELLTINKKEYKTDMEGCILIPIKYKSKASFLINGEGLMPGRITIQNNGKVEYLVDLRTDVNWAKGSELFIVRRNRLKQHIEGQTVYLYPLSPTMPNK